MIRSAGKPGINPENRDSVTPAIVKGMPFNMICRPTTSEAPANESRQSSSVNQTTRSAPGRSSSGRSGRPIDVRRPSVSKQPPVIVSVWRLCSAPWISVANDGMSKPHTPRNIASRRSGSRILEKSCRSRPSLSTPEICTSSRACSTGSDRKKTGSIRLNAARFDAIPIASSSVTIVANPGLLLSDRIACFMSYSRRLDAGPD